MSGTVPSASHPEVDSIVTHVIPRNELSQKSKELETLFTRLVCSQCCVCVCLRVCLCVSMCLHVSVCVSRCSWVNIHVSVCGGQRLTLDAVTQDVIHTIFEAKSLLLLPGLG